VPLLVLIFIEVAPYSHFTFRFSNCFHSTYMHSTKFTREDTSLPLDKFYGSNQGFLKYTVINSQIAMTRLTAIWAFYSEITLRFVSAKRDQITNRWIQYFSASRSTSKICTRTNLPRRPSFPLSTLLDVSHQRLKHNTMPERFEVSHQLQNFRSSIVSASDEYSLVLNPPLHPPKRRS
jgi:hypothetical protein